MSGLPTIEIILIIESYTDHRKMEGLNTLSQTAETLNFEVGVYRPPSEGGSYSLLVRFTRNCPWNHCTFCSMYKDEKFQIRPPDEIKADIDAVAAIAQRLYEYAEKSGRKGQITREAAIALLSEAPELNYHNGFPMVVNWLQAGGKTAFIQDANSLLMKTEHIVDVLQYLRTRFPSIERVTSYARSHTLARKSTEELTAIRQAGLDRVHVGLETGDDELLKKIKKGVTGADHIKGGQKAMAAGFQLSEYWMPGLGGKDHWENHARNTALVLNAINPHYNRSRPFNPAPGTPLYAEYEAGTFRMQTPREQLVELQLMIETLDLTSKVCFDHAANYWRDSDGRLLFSHGYEGYQFPEEKQKVLDRIKDGLDAKNRRPHLLQL